MPDRGIGTPPVGRVERGMGTNELGLGTGTPPEGRMGTGVGTNALGVGTPPGVVAIGKTVAPPITATFALATALELDEPPPPPEPA